MRFALTFVLLAACGGGNAENPQNTAPTASASASTAPSASASTTTAPAADVWSDSMSKDQQAAFMKKNVVPAMGPVFQAFDGKKYAEFGCKTCHGPAFKVLAL